MALPDPLAPFDSLRVWSRGGQRAPHKPLLVLYALGRLVRGEARFVPFREVKEQLGRLLREFGPERHSYHPEFPFWRLANDGVWHVEVDRPHELRFRVSNTDPPQTELLAQNARGAFMPDVERAFRDDPVAITLVARRLLASHFPETLHDDILAAVGLDVTSLEAAVGDVRELVSRRRRDPGFRRAVLEAYGERCAVCGYDLTLGGRTLGIEAAHIRWHQARGPDGVDNGLALCSQHHKLFDLGAFTLVEDERLVVSDRVIGRERLGEVLLRHHGEPLRRPARPEHRPDPAYLGWHRREVFKGSPRKAG